MSMRQSSEVVDRTFARFDLSDLLQNLRNRSADVYLVGGAVRDAVRNSDLSPVDVDLMTSGDIDSFRDAFESIGAPRLNRHGNMRFALPCGRHLDLIHTGRFYGRAGSVEHALSYFDASVNALAVHISGADSILDPLGGMDDLAKGRLTLPTLRWTPGDAFEDVHVLLRTIRLVERTELQIANPHLAVPHRRRFDEVDWADLLRLNGFGREAAERSYSRIFEAAWADRPMTASR